MQYAFEKWLENEWMDGWMSGLTSWVSLSELPFQCLCKMESLRSEKVKRAVQI